MGNSTSISYEDKLEKVAEILRKPDSKVLFCVGAGISATSDGEPLIPDFRSPGTGLFYNLAKLNLPTPESVFDIDFFTENPQPFYSLCKDLHPELVKFPPTRFHYLMKLTNDHSNLIRVFSQNIDCLERATGLTESKIIEAHGSFAEEFCIKCHKKANKQHFTKQLHKGEIPKCEYCKGVLKPGIVFYGEQLPPEFDECFDSDLTDDVDLCVFAGTSLNVYPFASLASETSEKTLRVLINREPAGDFLHSPRKSDIILLGDCDEIADKLAQMCGWKDELDKLVDAHKTHEHAKTAQEMVEDMKKDKNLSDEIKGGKPTHKAGEKRENKEEEKVEAKSTKSEENASSVEDLAKELEELEVND